MVLRLRKPAPSRWKEAKCLSIDVTVDDPFFSEDEIDREEAANFCNGTVDGIACPIRNECLLFALTNNEEYGIWGGTSELTRKAIRKKHPVCKGNKANPDWRWMEEDEALEGLSDKEIQDLRNTLIYDD